MVQSYDGIGLFIVFTLISLSSVYIAQYYRSEVPLLNGRYMHSQTAISMGFMLISFCLFWGLAAFRYEVGVDWETYLIGYNRINSLSNIGDYYEIGYGFLNFVCKKLFNNFQAVIIISSALTGGFLWKTMYRDADSLPIALLGLIAANLYTMSFTVIRQFVAIAIISISIPYIEQKKFWKFLLVLILATSFHYTAAIFTVVYYFCNQKSNRLITWKNIMFVMCVAFVLVNLNSILDSAIGIASSLRDNYTSYASVNTLGKDIKEVIMLIPVPAYAIIYRKKLIELNPNNRVYIWMSVFMIILKFIGLTAVNFSRLYYYFIISMPILFSYAGKITKKEYKLFLIFAVVVYSALSIANIIEYQAIDFLPYTSIFNR